MKSKSTRREFITISSFAGAGALAGLKIPNPEGILKPGPVDIPTDRKLLVKPRYYRWDVNPGQEWIEANTGSSRLDWKIPVSQTALILVDVWQRHYIKDPEQRAEAIINEKLLPLLSSLRKAGVKIIHAPSPEVAVTHPNWVKTQTREQVFNKRDEWPPEEFITSSGAYKPFAMPYEPMEEVRAKMAPLTFHPKVMPLKDEPVVADGIELHGYLKKNKLLFLLYAGFNTNACIINRDYGTIRMRDRGYRIILVRDCTTGMESKDTQATMAQTNGTILNLEMFGCFTVTSDELTSGLT
jgi:nicotinamidase-related amidase